MAKQINLENKINEKVQTQFRDMELEYQLMAYLVRQKPKASSIVRRDWFSDELLREAYTVVRKHQGKFTKKSMTVLMKKEYRREDPELIDECVDDIFIADLSNIDDKGGMVLIEQVMQLYEGGRMVKKMANVLSNLKEWNLEEAKEAMRDISHPVGFYENIEEGGYLEDFNERWQQTKDREALMNASETGSLSIPTGITEFDYYCGGIMPGEFAVIAGTTGVGKTAGLVDFAVQSWLNGYNTVLVSGEMSKESLQYRLDMNLSGINGMKFRRSELTAEDYVKWSKTFEYHNAVNEAILYTVAFSRNFDCGQIDNVLTRLEEDTGKKIQWLGIDYLNIMQSTDNRGDSRDWESQANVVWDVKALTQDRMLTTWSCNQVKDEAFEKELFELSDLKYARAISETAPAVVAFVRSDTDILADRMKLQVLKMRNAVVPKKPFILYPDMSTMRLNPKTATGLKSLEDIGKKEKIKTVRKKKHTNVAKDVRRREA